MAQMTRLEELAIELGTDYKTVMTILFGLPAGSLNLLETEDKSSVIAAINEARLTGGSAAPDEATEVVPGILRLASLAQVADGTDTTRAVTAAGVRQERLALKAEILGGVGPAYDTLSELLAVAQAAEESSIIADLVTVVGNKADASNVYTKAEIGDINTDLVAIYTQAKNA